MMHKKVLCCDFDGCIADYSGGFKGVGVPFDEINYNKDNPPGSNKGKPLADVYIDDRGLTFRGDWKASYNDIINFTPWQGQ